MVELQKYDCINSTQLLLSFVIMDQQITTVHPEGLAAQHGLTSKSPTASGDDFCNWCLTEINNRPLNLYFKNNEVSDLAYIKSVVHLN
jgi:hypothetical protein